MVISAHGESIHKPGSCRFLDSSRITGTMSSPAQSIGYTATWHNTAPIEEQRRSLLPHCDKILSDNRISYEGGRRYLTDAISMMGSGDTLVVHELSVIVMSLTAWHNILSEIMQRKASLKLISEGLVFSSDTTIKIADYAHLRKKRCK